MSEDQEIRDYSIKQALVYGTACTLNDILRNAQIHPIQFLNDVLWDFSIGGVLTSLYCFLNPQKMNSKLGKFLSVTIPPLILSTYEIASKNIPIGQYDPKDLIAYTLGSSAAYLGIEHLSTKEKRKETKQAIKNFKKDLEDKLGI